MNLAPLKVDQRELDKERDRNSFASLEPKVYRMTLCYRYYHIGIGLAALGGTIKVYDFWILSAVLALFALFTISRPFLCAVIVDQFSVTLKTTFSKYSIQRSSITAFEYEIGRTHFVVLWGNRDKNEYLRIADIFSFDAAWDHWLSTYRDRNSLSLF